MYQKNLGRNSLSESIVSNRSAEKEKDQQRKRASFNGAVSSDSLGNSSSSGSLSSRGNGIKVDDDGRRESVKMDYNNTMPTYQEISDQREPSIDDGVSDVDSIEDAQESASRVTTTQVQIHAAKADVEFDDDEAESESEIPKDPVVTAYLEKASRICQNNCVKSMTQFNSRSGQDEGIFVEDPNVEDAIVPDGNSNHLLLSGPAVAMKNRRTSLSSGSVGRMETIVEEPIEAKVSVKEILARFETLRESAEVMHSIPCSLLSISSYGQTASDLSVYEPTNYMAVLLRVNG